MANYTYSTNGVEIPDTSEILETVQTEFQSALGSDLSLEENTPQTGWKKFQKIVIFRIFIHPHKTVLQSFFPMQIYSKPLS